MKLSDEERNRIRCSVALSVPLVLDAIVHPDPTTLQNIQHMLPTYVLKCSKKLDISPYFTPWNLSDTGKKRVYVNSNGYRIRYLTHHKMKMYIEQIAKNYPQLTPENIRLIIDRLSARWVLLKGDANTKTPWDKFIENVVAVEPNPNKDNHPPADVTWVPINLLFCDQSFAIKTPQLSDPMTDITIVISKFKLITPREES